MTDGHSGRWIPHGWPGSKSGAANFYLSIDCPSSGHFFATWPLPGRFINQTTGSQRWLLWNIFIRCFLYSELSADFWSKFTFRLSQVTNSTMIRSIRSTSVNNSFNVEPPPRNVQKLSPDADTVRFEWHQRKSANYFGWLWRLSACVFRHFTACLNDSIHSFLPCQRVFKKKNTSRWSMSLFLLFTDQLNLTRTF